MIIEENKFIITDEVTDEMSGEFLEVLNSSNIETVVIKTPEISSSIMQILFCIAKSKHIECEEPFLAKFFESVEYTK